MIRDGLEVDEILEEEKCEAEDEYLRSYQRGLDLYEEDSALTAESVARKAEQQRALLCAKEEYVCGLCAKKLTGAVELSQLGMVHVECITSWERDFAANRTTRNLFGT